MTVLRSPEHLVVLFSNWRSACSFVRFTVPSQDLAYGAAAPVLSNITVDVMLGQSMGIFGAALGIQSWLKHDLASLIMQN